MDIPLLDGLFQKDKDEDKPISLEQLKRFQEIDITVDRLMILLGLYTGLSIDELLVIRKADIDTKAQTIKVYDKQGKRERVVYIPKWLSDEFQDYVAKMNLSTEMIFTIAKPTVYARAFEYSQKLIGYRKSWLAIRRTYLVYCASHVPEIPITIASENSGLLLDEIKAYWAKTPEEKRMIVNGNDINGRRKKN